jgi:hypothetical protein
MPQLVVLFAAGAGLYAGLKWVTRQLESQAAEARAFAEEAAKAAAQVPKDLGDLVWNEAAKAYTPRERRSG